MVHFVHLETVYLGDYSTLEPIYLGDYLPWRLSTLEPIYFGAYLPALCRTPALPAYPPT
jgi:hypothetical protein